MISRSDIVQLILLPLDLGYHLWGLFEDVTVQVPTAGSIVTSGFVLLLLFVSGFVSASEVAFLPLTPDDLSEIGEENRPADPVIKHLPERLEYLLVSILIASNFINVAVVMLCIYTVNAWINFSAAPLLGFVPGTILLAFLLLLFGEVVPKIHAQKNSLRFICFLASVLSGLERSYRSFSKTLVNSISAINKALAKKKYDISVDELSRTLELTSTEIPREKGMLAEIIKFYNKTVDEITIPCLDMKDIKIKISFREVVDFIVKPGHSRIPVYSETEDNMKGILYIKGSLPYIGRPDTFRRQGLIRPAYFVPETKKIDGSLEEFHTSKIYMVIVVGGFGGTSGTVMVEDILEETVGEIFDKYDEDEQQFVRLADSSLTSEAKILLADFFRVIDADPPDFGKLTEKVETLAGLLLEIKGDFPRRREIIDLKEYRFQVLEVDNRRILKVKSNRIPEGTRNDENEGDTK